MLLLRLHAFSSSSVSGDDLLQTTMDRVRVAYKEMTEAMTRKVVDPSAPHASRIDVGAALAAARTLGPRRSPPLGAAAGGGECTGTAAINVHRSGALVYS